MTQLILNTVIASYAVGFWLQDAMLGQIRFISLGGLLMLLGFWFPAAFGAVR